MAQLRRIHQPLGRPFLRQHYAPGPFLLSLSQVSLPLTNNLHQSLQYDLPPNSASPLFLHANLLKHTSGVSRGSTFTKIKSAPSPDANSSSLDSARMWVYDGPGRGMCVDLEVGEGEKEAVVQDWDDVALRGLESFFYDEGGRAGGW